MARLQAVFLAIALSSVAADDNNGREEIPSGTDVRVGCEEIKPVGNKAECCKYIDAREFNGATGAQKNCVPSVSDTFKSGNWCEPKCFVDGTGCGETATGQDFQTTAYNDAGNIFECYPAPPTTTPEAKATETPSPTTTTFTPWDSSASSSDSTALDSSYSSSFKTYEDSSAQSSWDNSASDASGSSGSFMKLWQWGILGALATCCLCAICAAMMKPKPKKKKPTPKPAPVPEPEPMPELAPLMPVTTAMPATTSYVQQVQAPMTYAPVTTYAQPYMQAQAGYVV